MIPYSRPKRFDFYTLSQTKPCLKTIPFTATPPVPRAFPLKNGWGPPHPFFKGKTLGTRLPSQRHIPLHPIYSSVPSRVSARGRREQAFSLLPSPPSPLFLALSLRSIVRAITRSETLATQTTFFKTHHCRKKPFKASLRIE